MYVYLHENLILKLIRKNQKCLYTATYNLWSKNEDCRELLQCGINHLNIIKTKIVGKILGSFP